jgi:hypothetical protein
MEQLPLVFKVDASALKRSVARLLRGLDSELEDSLNEVLDRVAQRIKETKTYTDRSATLVSATQSAGATGSFIAGTLSGSVGFSAFSKNGFDYGEALEFGTPGGQISEGEWMFARRSLTEIVEFTDEFERGLTRAFKDAGFA